MVLTALLSAALLLPALAVTRHTKLVPPCTPFPLCDPSSHAMQAPPPTHYGALFETTAGSFTVDVVSNRAPHAARRFHNLVRLGFYDNTYFFRVIAGFVAQFGLSGNPALQARYCNDETCPPAAESDGAALPTDAVRMSNTRGTMALSLMQGGVNGSVELFINLGNNSRLDKLGFAPFGVVRGRAGMDVVDALYAGYGELNESSICTKPHELCKGPKLQRILDEGNVYLASAFPDLSRIVQARVVPSC